MGILNSKSRIIDTVITVEGRRQLAQGGVDIKYVSFTDANTFYAPDVASGSQDATRRIYFESCQLPQDDIVFRADDGGNLQPFRNSDGVQVQGGRIVDYTFAATTSSFITGSTQGMTTLTGSAFSEAAQTLLASSLKNFQRLYLVATKDKIFEDDGFGLGPDAVTFTITDQRPIRNVDQRAVHVNSLDSIFSDPRFGRLPNFKYLPPCVKISDRSIDKGDPRATSQFTVGNFAPWGRTHVEALTYEQVTAELQYYANVGCSQMIHFDPTSRENRLVGQFFEQKFDALRKLDIIDFGTFQTGNPASPVSQIFFIGKVEVDERGTDTFLHLFTLVFE